MEEYVKESKALAYFLRHDREVIPSIMDEEGWVHIPDLIRVTAQQGYNFTYQMLERIVTTDSKNRYSLVDGRTTYGENGVKFVRMKIRANQGHSTEKAPKFEQKSPPPHLWHGTAVRTYGPIMKEGICKRSRNHVHLSHDLATAWEVGARHGTPVVVGLDVEAMVKDGIKFYESENGVWLVDHVAPKYVTTVLWDKPRE